MIKLSGFIAVCITGVLLLSAVGDFPHWGDPHSPANDAPLSNFYIEKTEELTAVPNLVTAVLADYRGYDTMFETVVVFTAGMSILAILRVVGSRAKEVEEAFVPYEPVSDSARIIISNAVKLCVPVIQIFALYVVAHGHHSPGGGFQGGVIFGASFILMALVTDLRTVLQRFTEKKFIFFAGLGIIIYAGFGWGAQLLGSNFLNYSVLEKVMPNTDSVMARSHSMLGVEIGVAFTVASIMFAIYAYLSSNGKMKGGL